MQWADPVVAPTFEAKDDYQVLYLLARKLGFAEPMFRNIKVEGDRPVPEDVLREINRGSWSTGYTGQSPERLKAHMRNQAKFDLVKLRAPKDDPEVGGAFYGALALKEKTKASRRERPTLATRKATWESV